MNAQTAAPISPRRAPQLVVTIAIAVLLFAASFQSASAQTAPTLGTAKSFGVLGGSTVTNTGPSSISGDLGVSPGSAVTGFPPGLIVPPGFLHAAPDAVALQAQNDVTTAYNFLTSQPCTRDFTGIDLGYYSLIAGVYCFSSSAQLTGPLTLNAKGNANAVFIFKVGSTLTTASNASVRLINGAQPCNVFWQVGSSATLGTYTSFIGNILALTSITLTTGTTVNGRALARNGAVTLDSNNVLFSACSAGTTSGGDTGPIPGSGPGPGGTPDTPPVAGPGPVCTEVKAPKIVFTKQIVGPPTQWLVTAQDTGSGLASIVVSLAVNITTSIPAFTPGTTAPIVVTATVIGDSASAQFGITATDSCGNVASWDPVDFTIATNQTVTVAGISQFEHYLTITNDGLQALIITVNGNYDRTVWLKQDTIRTINIASAMAPGDDNSITVEALGLGMGHGQAEILVRPK